MFEPWNLRHATGTRGREQLQKGCKDNRSAIDVFAQAVAPGSVDRHCPSTREQAKPHKPCGAGWASRYQREMWPVKVFANFVERHLPLVVQHGLFSDPFQRRYNQSSSSAIAQTSAPQGQKRKAVRFLDAERLRRAWAPASTWTRARRRLSINGNGLGDVSRNRLTNGT